MSTINSSSILNSLSSGDATTTPSTSRFSELTSEDFVKIMFTELSNQDPLKPNDSNQLLQQMSSLRSIESDLKLSKKLDSVVSQSEFATAGALLGKYVQGFTDNADPVQGLVKSVSQTRDGPVLNLSNGARVAFKNLANILEAPTSSTGNGSGSGTGTGAGTGTGSTGSTGPARPVTTVPQPTATGPATPDSPATSTSVSATASALAG